ncbi:323_t:CDS:2 [Cetraspora pellucida]|uniref:323_t:CDS:1 n=1 Tax=Cetraspora pellucida TaxID=1433469 RepID=A0A9N9FL94_9GLOM|nr:323_t:CDS:2 [Cetraspora pellucida]
METIEIESEPSTETMPKTMPETMPEIMSETMPETIDYLLPTSNEGNRCEVCNQIFDKSMALTTINRHFERFYPIYYSTIKQCKFKQLNLYSPNDRLRVDALNKHLLEWIVINQQSFLLVENASFINFIRELDSHYRLLCHQTLSTWINKEYELYKDTIKIELCRILLDIISFNKNHTVINQANLIIRILKKIDIGKKLLGITTDNAANMCSMGRILQKKMLSEFNNNVKLRNSSSLLRELKKICEMKNVSFLMPEADMKTHILVASNKTLDQSYPIVQEWKNVWDLIIILEPIYHATMMLSSLKFSTQGDLCMIFQGLIRHLTNYTNSELTTQSAMSNAIKTKLESYWCYLNRSSIISDLLDPYNKLATYESENRKTAINMLHQVFEKYEPDGKNKPLLSEITTTKTA